MLVLFHLGPAKDPSPTSNTLVLSEEMESGDVNFSLQPEESINIVSGPGSKGYVCKTPLEITWDTEWGEVAYLYDIDTGDITAIDSAGYPVDVGAGDHAVHAAVSCVRKGRGIN